MKISIILFCVLFVFQSTTLGQHNASYLEENSKEELIDDTTELVYDTIVVHDTVFVSDIDGFLKQYGCNLGTFAKKYGPMKHMVDSINKLSEERLFYNYFLPQDHDHKLSTRFIVKTFRVKHDLLEQEEATASDIVDRKQSVRNEILFTCKGADDTDHFLRNPVAITRVILGMFTFMQEQESFESTKIKGINLYFPDFTFRDKRAMLQFVKSVRIIMDASYCFKPPKTRLNVTFLTLKGTKDLDKAFLYALMQEATEVICLHEDFIDSCYVNGNSITSLKELDVNLIDQIVSHYYIARYYTGPIDISKSNLICFSKQVIGPYLQADYSENTWEIFLLLLLLTVFLIILVVVLYYTCLSVSTFMNKYIESVVLVSVMLLLELLALAITTFQHMSEDDNFSQLQKHPLLLFSLPFVIVLVIPMLKGISKKRRIP
jgi:hypothetical protein